MTLPGTSLTMVYTVTPTMRNTVLRRWMAAAQRVMPMMPWADGYSGPRAETFITIFMISTATWWWRSETIIHGCVENFMPAGGILGRTPEQLPSLTLTGWERSVCGRIPPGQYGTAARAMLTVITKIAVAHRTRVPSTMRAWSTTARRSSITRCFATTIRGLGCG